MELIEPYFRSLPLLELCRNRKRLRAALNVKRHRVSDFIFGDERGKSSRRFDPLAVELADDVALAEAGLVGGTALHHPRLALAADDERAEIHREPSLGLDLFRHQDVANSQEGIADPPGRAHALPIPPGLFFLGGENQHFLPPPPPHPS